MRIPVDVVTGFLGSGKTTLLRHVLAQGLCGQRVAVLVNDVADFDIDGRVIAAGRLAAVETVIELDNGCICCSLDARFELAVQDVVDNLRPDLVLIEASGVADPRLLLDKIEGTMLALDAVITVVDCEGVAAALEWSEAARGQVEEADFVVLNKTDLVLPAEVDRVASLLGGRNPRALQVRTCHGSVAEDLMFGTSVRRFRQRAGEVPAHLVADGIESFTCETTGSLRRDSFAEFLATLPEVVYRAKGIVRLVGEHAPSLFNYVRGRVHLQWLPAAVSANAVSQGVFIGRGVLAHREDISRRFRVCGGEWPPFE